MGGLLVIHLNKLNNRDYVMSENITVKNIEDVYRDSYGIYGTSTVFDRALPSVEDGLNPVSRRILLTFNDISGNKLRKAAQFVGHALG